MCRRICLSRSVEEIKRHFAVADGHARLKPHWNIAVGGVLPAIRWGAFRRRLDLMHWGLVMAAAQNTRIVRSCFHINGDQADELSHRRSHRCLIPVESFYEWRRADKQPFAVALKSRQIMAIAGVWDFWISPLGEPSVCFALLTTNAISVLAPLSAHMPILVRRENWDLWLNPDAPLVEVQALTQPAGSEPLDIWAVDRRISSTKNDGPNLLVPLEH